MSIKNNFKMVLNWSIASEKVYEYVISNCKEFFGVQNLPYLTFHIIDFKDEGKLFIAIYNDYFYDKAHEYFSNLNSKNIEATGLNYKKEILEINNLNNLDQIYYHKQLTLNVNEIRYLFLTLEDIKYLLNVILNDITNKVMKVNSIFSKIIYDNCESNFRFFASTTYDTILNLNTDYELQFEDITNKVVNKFI